MTNDLGQSVCAMDRSYPVDCTCGRTTRPNRCAERIPGTKYEVGPGTHGYDSARCLLEVGHSGPHAADFHYWDTPEPCWEGMGL